MSSGDSLIFILKKSVSNSIGTIRLVFKRNGYAKADDRDYERVFTNFDDSCIVDASFIQNGKEILGTVVCDVAPCDFSL